MADHGSYENGINWTGVHIRYMELHIVLNEAEAGFTQLQTDGVTNVTFLSGITRQTIHNLEELN